MKDFQTSAAHLFKHYPRENKIFFTKDGQAFFTQVDAENHGKSLCKKGEEVEVTAITRAEAAKAPAQEKEQGEVKAAPAETKKAADEKKAADSEAGEKKAADKKEAEGAETEAADKKAADKKTAEKPAGKGKAK